MNQDKVTKYIKIFKRYQQPVTYLVIGGMSAGVDLGLLILLKGAMGVGVVIAASASYIISMLFNFTANKIITFKAGLKDKYSSQLMRYLVLAAINYVITVTSIWLFSGVLGINYILVKVVILILLAVANFFLYKKIIYV